LKSNSYAGIDVLLGATDLYNHFLNGGIFVEIFEIELIAGEKSVECGLHREFLIMYLKFDRSQRRFNGTECEDKAA
jgi:hypothetical protein